jgi:RimJ/RimL family protein N-acetyltransferase
MIYPIHFENEHYLIHSFRPVDLERFSALTEDVYRILSDERTLHYIPSKRLSSLTETEVFLRTMIINFHTGRNFLHFITEKKTSKVVGIIDLISPELAREHYQITLYPFFVEFYLGSFATGCYLMTEILPVVIQQLLDQGIENIGAIVNRENTAAKKVLTKARFRKKQLFDLQQDFYQLEI